MKNVQMKKLIFFFLRIGCRDLRILPFRIAEITVGLLGLQQEFDFGIPYLSGFDYFVSFTNHDQVYF